jgi:hypothetical protein
VQSSLKVTALPPDLWEPVWFINPRVSNAPFPRACKFTQLLLITEGLE